MKSTIHEVTGNRAKKLRVFVTLRVISWIVTLPSKQRTSKWPTTSRSFGFL